MRLLFLSNFYPPARIGGYGQQCHDVATGLRARGHVVDVLTSRYRAESLGAPSPHVYRLLHIQGNLDYYQPLRFFLGRRRREAQNADTLTRLIHDLEPEAVLVWGMWALSRALPALAEQVLPSRVLYYVSDQWPASSDMHTTYWRLPAEHWYMRLPKQVLGTIALAMLRREASRAPRFEHVMCVSAALRDQLLQAGLPIQHARVVHNGIDVRAFKGRSQDGRFSAPDRPLRVLYAGQVVSHKGVHTAIEALAHLRRTTQPARVTLTVVGNGHPEYEASLRGLVQQHGLQDQVAFQQAVPRGRMPEVFQQHDVLVLPSIYEEPLALIVQEAMAAGLVVVGTTTGGTGEILTDGENGLTFPARDAVALAAQLSRLAADPALGRRLAEAGRTTVLAHFTLERMVDEIETYTRDVVAGRIPSAAELLAA
jgi:glycosyltransferase involved in cell wall biosynthesis